MVRVLLVHSQGGWYGEVTVQQLGFGNGINVAAVRRRIYANSRYLFAHDCLLSKMDKKKAPFLKINLEIVNDGKKVVVVVIITTTINLTLLREMVVDA
jgi:hypothetical protein